MGVLVCRSRKAVAVPHGLQTAINAANAFGLEYYESGCGHAAIARTTNASVVARVQLWIVDDRPGSAERC